MKKVPLSEGKGDLSRHSFDYQLEHDPRSSRAWTRRGAALEAGRGIPIEQVRAELGLVNAEKRAAAPKRRAAAKKKSR